MTGGLSTNFHGVGIGPLSKILAVKSGIYNTYLYEFRTHGYFFINLVGK